MKDLIQNPRGEWSMKDSTGKLILYKEGDQVSKDGFLYSAIRNTMGYSPDQGERAGWKKLNENRIIKFTSGSNPPSEAYSGDEWFDTSTGTLYKYIVDEDTSQWVSF